VGTGEGTTVLELLAAFRRVTGLDLPASLAPRRRGDAVGAYTRSARAREWLGWSAQRSLEDGIRDTLEWFSARGEKLADLMASAGCLRWPACPHEADPKP
jgi:UDP-glucose 4-epimerase